MKRRGKGWITALLVAAFLLIYVPTPARAETAELTIQNKTEELRDAYNEYRKNLF